MTQTPPGHGLNNNHTSHHQGNPYFVCIEDLDTLFCNGRHVFATKADVFINLRRAKPDYFRKDAKGRSYVITTAIVEIARMLNLYVLAVLCRLNEHEILAGVADPLLRTIPYPTCHEMQMPLMTEYEWEPATLDGKEWFFHQSEGHPPSPTLSDPSPRVEQTAGRPANHDETRPLSWSHHSCPRKTNEPPPQPPCRLAYDVRLQQEAIIETRQLQKLFGDGKRASASTAPLHARRTTRKGKSRSLRLHVDAFPAAAHAGMTTAPIAHTPPSSSPSTIMMATDLSPHLTSPGTLLPHTSTHLPTPPSVPFRPSLPRSHATPITTATNTTTITTTTIMNATSTSTITPPASCAPPPSRPRTPEPTPPPSLPSFRAVHHPSSYPPPSSMPSPINVRKRSGPSDKPTTTRSRASFDDLLRLPRFLHRPPSSLPSMPSSLPPRESSMKRRSCDLRARPARLDMPQVKEAKLPRLEPCNNNLDLLATQATRMRDLPLSPDVSPPLSTLPPTLPPIKHMLSDLPQRLGPIEHPAQ